jgi:hypothetical protein
MAFCFHAVFLTNLLDQEVLYSIMSVIIVFVPTQVIVIQKYLLNPQYSA